MSSIIPFTFPETGQPVLPDFPGEPVVKGLEGHVYVVEFNTGGIKVGYTADPRTRLASHARSARDFGRRAVRGFLSGPHFEARANERELIRWCVDAAGLPKTYAGEYFQVAADAAAGFIATLSQTRGDVDAFALDVEQRAGALMGALGFGNLPRRFGPVFPWAKHLTERADLDAFLNDLRDAMEASDPLAAIDHAAAEWANYVAVEQAAMHAAIEGGAA